MSWWPTFLFSVFIFALIMIDLCVLNRKAHAITIKKALAFTAMWISVGLAFNVLVYFLFLHPEIMNLQAGPEQLTPVDAALQFFTAYLIEYALSVDNLFVIATIMASFRVPAQNQHRLLFWGILGAAVLRGLMIYAGAALVHQFDWIMYVFGALLIYSAIKMYNHKPDDIDIEGNVLVRLTRKLYPVTTQYHGTKFVAMEDGRRVITPMLLALLLIESCDVMFAIDSIPAALSITQNPFLILTSNIFAILGLRSLYFALAGLMDKFRYLSTSLVFLLAFVGTKMILHHWLPIPVWVSLSIIAGILVAGVIASLIASRKQPKLDAPVDLADAPRTLE